MREIKFRAWDIDNEYMHENVQDGLNATKNGVPVLGLSLGTIAKDAGNHIMQFTGLKDKNGVDIYEGDLLRFPPKDDYEKQTYNAFEVFFHGNDAASYHIGWQMNRMHTQGHSAGGASFGFLPKNTAKMEVIGNIHQNLELLK